VGSIRTNRDRCCSNARVMALEMIVLPLSLADMDHLRSGISLLMMFVTATE